MLENFKYHRQLGQLQRERDTRRKQWATPYGTQPIDNVNALAERLKIDATYSAKIRILATEYLRMKAERYLLPLPQDEESNWEWVNDGSLRVGVLNESTMAKFEAVIREYERYERERIGFWVNAVVSILSTVIGVVGILIAYSALR